jgi:hypothetical protein
VDVGNAVLRISGRSCLADRVPLLDTSAALDQESPDMCQRCLVAVSGCDGDGQAVRRHLPGERDLARCRCTYRIGITQRDVDATVLAARVRVVAERELS